MVEVTPVIYEKKYGQKVDAEEATVQPPNVEGQGCCGAYSAVRPDEHGFAQY